MKKLKVIYLENDVLWQLLAETNLKSKPIDLQIVSTSKEFWAVLKKASKDAVLLLDSDLGEDITGEEIGKIAYQLGFRNIHMASAHEAERFKGMSWIKSITDKKGIIPLIDSYLADQKKKSFLERFLGSNGDLGVSFVTPELQNPFHYLNSRMFYPVM